jgi:hypothetical protein
MDIKLGWGHPAYLRALTFYVQFPHGDRQVEAANIVERQIRQAEAVVDVHSIQTAQGNVRQQRTAVGFVLLFKDRLLDSVKSKVQRDRS